MSHAGQRIPCIEVIAVIGWYVLSTFTNNLAQTRVDDFWTP